MVVCVRLVSLIAFVVIVVLAIRSRDFGDAVHLQWSPDRVFGAESANGYILVYCVPPRQTEPFPARIQWFHGRGLLLYPVTPDYLADIWGGAPLLASGPPSRDLPLPIVENYNLGGFAAQLGQFRTANSALFLIPDWSIALIALVPLIPWVAGGWRTRRRARAGLCASCAYDLRYASSPRCPECGAPIRMPVGPGSTVRSAARH